MAARFLCKCGHRKMSHEITKKDGWCASCDCDSYEADQHRLKNAGGRP